MNKTNESENIYRDIFESFLDLYVRCDLNGDITMCSPSIKSILGYEITQAVGKNITDYYLYNPRTKALFRTLVKKKSIKNFEISLTAKNGDIIPCLCNIRLLTDNSGKPKELECICRDITKLKATSERLEEAKSIAEQSLKVKDQFLANMSHEIRTPMNGIIGLMELLEETKLDDKQRSYLATMRDSSELLLKLLNDIISFAKVRTKKLKPAKDVFSIHKLLGNIQLLYYVEAQKKKISIVTNIKETVPEYIQGDETRLTQILSNLLSNAIKFSHPNGNVFITVGFKDLGKSKSKLEVSIKDEGIGIAKKYHNKLFQSFSQVDDSYSKPFGGAGLGLSISKELVEFLGGNIQVESDFGKGSTFTFNVAVKPANMPGKTPEKKVNGTHIGKANILLVEDNDVNRMVAKEILLKANNKVDTAENGFEALEKVKSNQYDLILMDIQLPEMNGVDTMKKIKHLFPANCPPVIALTAYSSDEEKKTFLDAGFDDYVSKPFHANEILNTINHWKTHGKSSSAAAKQPVAHHDQLTLNVETINQLIKYSDIETVQTSLQEFNKDAMHTLKIADKLVKKENYEKLGELVHAIKGNSGTLGGDRLFEVSRNLEQNIRKGDFATLHEGLKELYLEIKAYKRQVKEQLNIALDE